LRIEGIGSESPLFSGGAVTDRVNTGRVNTGAANTERYLILVELAANIIENPGSLQVFVCLRIGLGIGLGIGLLDCSLMIFSGE
jgi:hypothetical protein